MYEIVSAIRDLAHILVKFPVRAILRNVTSDAAVSSVLSIRSRSRLNVLDPNGYVGGRTVTVFYQYGHVDG